MCVVGNSYACSCFIRIVQFGLCVVNQKVFGMKIFIFPVHSIPMGFGCDHCHALTEFSDLLSLTFCCVALMCWFLQKSGIWFGTKWLKKQCDPLTIYLLFVSWITLWTHHVKQLSCCIWWSIVITTSLSECNCCDLPYRIAGLKHNHQKEIQNDM